MFRLNDDAWLVVIEGEMHTFHYRVTVAELVNEADAEKAWQSEWT